MTTVTPAASAGPDGSEAQLGYVGLTALVASFVVEVFGFAASGVNSGKLVSESLAVAGIGTAIGLVVLALRGPLVRILFGASAQGVRGNPAVAHMITITLGFMGAWWLLSESLFLFDPGYLGMGAARCACGAVLVAWAGGRARRAAKLPAPIMVGAPQLARVVLLMWGLRLLPGTLMELFIAWYSAPGMLPAGQVAAAVVVLALIFLLIVKRNGIVRVVMGDLGAFPSPVPPLATLWGAGLAVIGLWILMWSLPGLLQPFVTDHLPAQLDPVPRPAVAGFQLAPWCQVMVAVLLIFEGHRLGAWWGGGGPGAKVREAGS